MGRYTMKLAIECVCYKEERFIPKFIQHYQDKVDTILVLNSSTPWNGEKEPDSTAEIARSLGADVIEYDWPTEEAQRNAGLEYLMDYDWVIVLDPDEFISNSDWDKLLNTLEHAEFPAYVVKHQRVFWKDKEVYPHTDYQQLIAVRPQAVRFVDKRVINQAYGEAPVDLFHFSWARTDEEILRKITHYAHAGELNEGWYENVWLTDKTTDLHPNTPETLQALVEPNLPPEIEELNLWP